MSNKAYVTDVQIGHLSIEGLMTDDREFFVAVPQISDRFQFAKNQASRDIKRLLGEGFQFVKLKTPLNPKAVNAVRLADFERVLIKLDRSGNKIAQEFRDDLVGLSLQQLFCDAFGVKFDQEDRQEWLKQRQEGKRTRRTFTDAIQAYIDRHPELSKSRAEFMYSNASDRVNKAVFGRIARILCRDFKASKDALRDSFTDTELRRIAMVEEEAMYLIDNQDCDPCQAVLVVREKFAFPVSDRIA